jgi:excisionase family DNA binding protein
MYVQVDFIKQELAEIKSGITDIKSRVAEINNCLVRPVKISVDVKDAAEMIGVSKSTIYVLMESRDIKFSIIGGKKVIKVKEVERLINDREISGKRRTI